MISRRWFWIEWRKRNLILKKCRGIGFDNAASIAGVHGGVQRLLQNKNRKAKFVVRSNHSLNLSSVHAQLWMLVLLPYSWWLRDAIHFSSSSHRWEVLSLYVKVMRKRLVTTRWSATLQSSPCSENRFWRSSSDTQFINLSFRKSSHEKGCKNPFAFNWKLFLHITFILRGGNSGTKNLIQKKFQEPGIGLDVCVIHMDVTKIFFNRNRDRLVSESLNQNKTQCWKIEIPVEKRIRRKRKLSEEKKIIYVKHLYRK